MIRLTFARPSATHVKQFDQEEITLVPAAGLDSNLSVNEALPSDWNLPWDPFARLTLSLEADGTLLATNVSGDPNILFRGVPLTSTYLVEGDQLSIGDLNIIWGANEALTDLELDQLIQEAEALLEEPEKKTPPHAEPIAAKLKQRRQLADRRRVITAASVAVALFVAILSLGIFLHVDTDRPATVIDQWALERQQALRPTTQEIVKLLESNTTRPTPEFHRRLEELLIRYDTLQDEQAHLLARQLGETSPTLSEIALQ